MPNVATTFEALMFEVGEPPTVGTLSGKQITLGQLPPRKLPLPHLRRRRQAAHCGRL